MVGNVKTENMKHVPSILRNSRSKTHIPFHYNQQVQTQLGIKLTMKNGVGKGSVERICDGESMVEGKRHTIICK